MGQSSPELCTLFGAAHGARGSWQAHAPGVQYVHSNVHRAKYAGSTVGTGDGVHRVQRRGCGMCRLQYAQVQGAVCRGQDLRCSTMSNRKVVDEEHVAGLIVVHRCIKYSIEPSIECGCSIEPAYGVSTAWLSCTSLAGSSRSCRLCMDMRIDMCIVVSLDMCGHVNACVQTLCSRCRNKSSTVTE